MGGAENALAPHPRAAHLPRIMRAATATMSDADARRKPVKRSFNLLPICCQLFAVFARFWLFVTVRKCEAQKARESRKQATSRRFNTVKAGVAKWQTQRT